MEEIKVTEDITIDENNPMEEVEVQEISAEDRENLKGDEE